MLEGAERMQRIVKELGQFGFSVDYFEEDGEHICNLHKRHRHLMRLYSASSTKSELDALENVVSKLIADDARFGPLLRENE